MDTNHFPEPVSFTTDEVFKYLTGIPTGITFIHGKAGCGKTTLIQKVNKSVFGCQVLVPTNLAASLYSNARTLHSFFHGAFDDLQEGFQDPLNLDSSKKSICFSKVQKIKLLVIDEVSMVRSDMIEMVNRICQVGKGNKLPFGGIPVVLVGDLFQLPPIVSDDAVYDYLKKEYGGIYFYDSHIIKNNINKINLFELTKSFRQQNDEGYAALLDEFRKPLTTADKVRLINALNSRVNTTPTPTAIYIASSNEEVRQVNCVRLGELSGPEQTLLALFSIRKRDWSGCVTLSCNDLPCDEDIYPIVVPSAYDAAFTFKIGARVMFTKNSKGYFLNGEFGTILDFADGSFIIRKDDGSTVDCPSDRYTESQMTDYRYEMVYDERTHKLTRKTPYIQKTIQYPLKLAYAFTIHKAQGQTYNDVILDLNSHIFAPGQLYVALSRVRSLKNLYLTKPVAYSDIISDTSVFDFIAKLRLMNQKSTAHYPTYSYCESSVINPTCDSFISFIKKNEVSVSAKTFMVHALNSYKTLVNEHEYDKAFNELQKVVDLIVASYQVADFKKDIKHIKENKHSLESCQFSLNSIFEIYTTVVKLPIKQVYSENRTISYTII